MDAPLPVSRLEDVAQVRGAARRASFTTPGLTDHFDNSAGPAIEALQLDLILFDQEGVIARRLAVDTAPLRAAKRRRRW
ncbi:hypothetical protein [Thiocapsa sp.]|uniref:hypothetical protein n=1 Tax=Thiocapsa sp. TaxID=2024551 RepID=UPI0035932E4B